MNKISQKSVAVSFLALQRSKNPNYFKKDIKFKVHDLVAKNVSLVVPLYTVHYLFFDLFLFGVRWLKRNGRKL